MTGIDLRWMFLYWGRRGFSRHAYEIASAAAAMADTATTVSASRNNEEFEIFKRFGDQLRPVSLYQSNAGALFQAWRIPVLRQIMRRWIESDRTEVIINLMPHIWSPFVGGVARRGGARYLTVVHDVTAHPGDSTGFLNNLHLQDIRCADELIVLSAHVENRLRVSGLAGEKPVHRLFLPDLSLDDACTSARRRDPAKKIRILALGRMQYYKGLELMGDALCALHARGVAFSFSALGEGDMSSLRDRLKGVDAHFDNRWLSNDEIAQALRTHDVLLLTHIEASQSGIVSLAYGAGMPVVATDTGGVSEQISNGKSGFLTAPDPQAIAAALARLATEPDTYDQMAQFVRDTASSRSPAAFAKKLKKILRP